MTRSEQHQAEFPANCKNCIYRGTAGRYPVCEYILHTHIRRPCPAGAGCTVKKTEKQQKEEKAMKQSTWDTEQARQLLEAGKSDLEVAEVVGVSLPALKSWKQRNGLARPRTVKAAADGQPKDGDATADTEPAKKTPRAGRLYNSKCAFAGARSVSTPRMLPAPGVC